MSTLTIAPEPKPKDSPRAESFYRPGLDIFRLLAFLLVFLAHGLIANINAPTQLGAIARAGEFGVCIFFFLSSYLITELLLKEKQENGGIAVRAFYIRRVLRIWPLYFAMIGVGLFLGHFSASHALSGAWLAALLLLCANWFTVGHGYPPGFLFPLWSISLEEQFYLVWPWLTKYLGSKVLGAISLLVIAAAYVVMVPLLAHGQSLDPGLWVNSFVQFQFFGLGALTALVLRGRVPRLGAFARLALLVAGLLCLRAAQAAVFEEDKGLPHDFAHIGPRFLVALVACLCLFFACLPMKGGRGHRFLVYLGKISYGLYVFHVLWLGVSRHVVARVLHGGGLSSQLAAMALALALTIASATVSYRYFESPFLRLKKRFTVVRSRPI
jgi:peptidoglycan/LPS O-acetylase OafA/YrhL